jgi:HEAT repeat protein
MRKMPLALFVLACLCGAASADLGDPTVQAVCQITLANGRSFEGFVAVAAGGYSGTHPSGFRFEAGSNKATHFLNVDFKKLARDPAGNYRIVLNGGRVVNESALRKPSKIVFLEWQQDIVSNQVYEQYKELDALTIVTELPYTRYIDPKYEGLRKGSVVTIPINGIVSFELIDRPAKKWLDHIKERREVGSEVDVDAEDLTEPDWYHEIRRNKESLLPIEYSSRGRQAKDISNLVRQLKNQNHGSFLRIKAARGLRDLGAKSKPAIPALIAALNDREYAVGFFAARALVKLGPSAVAGLAEALKNENERVRTEAVRVLGEIGPQAEPAIPSLTRMLKGEDASASLEAGLALSRIGPSGIRVLIEALSDQRDFVRRNAAHGLGKPDHATAAIPALIEALKDSDSSVREAAAQALGSIGQPAILSLNDALKDEDKVVRDGALRALVVIRPLEKAVIPLLIDGVKNPDKSVRISALTMLARIPTEAKVTVPALVEALKDQNADVRSAAAGALGAIGPDARDAVPVLIKAL